MLSSFSVRDGAGRPERLGELAVIGIAASVSRAVAFAFFEPQLGGELLNPTGPGGGPLLAGIIRKLPSIQMCMDKR